MADTGNHVIRRVTSATGEVTTLAGTAGTYGSADGTGAAARFYRPEGVACDGTNLYVADSWNDTIRRIVLASGVVTTLAGSAGAASSEDGSGGTARFNTPAGITVSGTDLYVADSYNNAVRKIAMQ